jgi:hypothetical protein
MGSSVSTSKIRRITPQTLLFTIRANPFQSNPSRVVLVDLESAATLNLRIILVYQVCHNNLQN